MGKWVRVVGVGKTREMESPVDETLVLATEEPVDLSLVNQDTVQVPDLAELADEAELVSDVEELLAENPELLLRVKTFLANPETGGTMLQLYRRSIKARREAAAQAEAAAAALKEELADAAKSNALLREGNDKLVEQLRATQAANTEFRLKVIRQAYQHSRSSHCGGMDSTLRALGISQDEEKAASVSIRVTLVIDEYGGNYDDDSIESAVKRFAGGHYNTDYELIEELPSNWRDKPDATPRKIGGRLADADADADANRDDDDDDD